MSPALAIDLAGWLAMILILAAYALTSMNRLAPTSRSFQLMNLIGGLLFVIHLYAKQAWPSMWLNVIWALIAAVTLIRMARRPPPTP